jgi:hypothetical protein
LAVENNAEGFQEGARVLDERRIMLGCMAGKGYKMDMSGLPTFPVGERRLRFSSAVATRFIGELCEIVEPRR